MVELPSRELVIDQLVRGCLDFPANRRPADVPVIILSGVQGSDKTSVLTDIRRRCAGVRPCVLRDLEGDHGSRPYEIIAHLAYGLSTRTKQFGELRFPRLLLGLIVVSGGLDRHDRRKARSELKSLLSDNRRLTDKVRDVGQGLLDEIGQQFAVSAILGLGIDGISKALWTLRVLRGKAFRWYREGTGQRFDSPLDALIALHSWQAEDTPRARADVDESLCSAFLADLRASFRDGWQAPKRTGNCVVMLDEADSPEGQGFLRALVAARHAVHSREGCDPLLVIAAGHTRFPVLTRSDGRVPAARAPERASRADWDSQRDGTAHSWLYSVRLGAADERDRKVLERRWPAVTAVPGAIAFAQRLTDGHPAGLRLILAGVSAQASQIGPHHVDLRDVLDWPDKDNPARNLADAALELMLRNASAPLRQDLITCSAAADVATASRRHALGLPAGAVSTALDRFCATDLWVSPAHESARPVLAPFLRRVLWHALGSRQGGASDDWETVHSRLQTYYRDDRGDHPAALHHGLAMGDLESAVLYLASRLRSIPSRQWLAELGAITRAPRIAAPTGRTPRDQVAHHAPAKDTLSRLVTAMWISNDPLGDPHGSLDVLIAADLNSLAPESADDSVLYDEAERISKRQNGSQL